jgi:hypothetical protein
LSERRRVGDVDHHLRALQNIGQALAGECIDTRVRRCGDGLVAARDELLDEPGADEAGAPDHDDLHVMPFDLCCLTGSS